MSSLVSYMITALLYTHAYNVLVSERTPYCGALTLSVGYLYFRLSSRLRNVSRILFAVS